MLKMRITFVNDKKGAEEYSDALNIIKSNFKVINISTPHKCRGENLYYNVYLDLDSKKDINNG